MPQHPRTAAPPGSPGPRPGDEQKDCPPQHLRHRKQISLARKPKASIELTQTPGPGGPALTRTDGIRTPGSTTALTPTRARARARLAVGQSQRAPYRRREQIHHAGTTPPGTRDEGGGEAAATGSPLTDSDLTHEANVVLLEDPEHPEHLDYVRQALDKTPRRKNEPRYTRDGRMTGRTELGADSEATPDSGRCGRRAFFLLPAPATPTPKASALQGAPGDAAAPPPPESSSPTA